MTDTRELEHQLMYIYENCQREDFFIKDGISARSVIDRFLEGIMTVDDFNHTNHMQIVNQIYFGRQNIAKANIETVALGIHVSVRSLSEYRQKYGKVFKNVLVHMGL